jgi:hypothetical protein
LSRSELGYAKDALDYINIMEKKLILSDVVKSLPTKDEITLQANKHSDISEVICEDEYLVIAKNEIFKEGAEFVVNRLK